MWGSSVDFQNGAGIVALTKQGSGTLAFTGSTTFSGQITAVGGTVSFADAEQIFRAAAECLLEGG